MAIVTPTERTTYAPIIHFLEDLGFVAVQEVKGNGFIDILLEYNNELFAIELKISDSKSNIHKELIEAIVQAYRYGLNLKTENIIAIVYPCYYRKERRIEEINEFTIEIQTEILALTKYWQSKEKTSIKDFFQTFKTKIDGNEESLKTMSLVVDILQTNVNKISENLLSFYVSKDDIKRLIEAVGKNHELFLSLGNFESIEKFTDKQKFVAIDLISYLLVNQILFYCIYQKLTNKVPAIDKKLESLKDINFYFDELRKIDFRAIYGIDIINNKLIPDTPQFVKDLNETIDLIKVIKPESVRHDLFGRMFHKLLPHRTRKVLAAFYTGVSSSEILAGLTIQDWKSSVWDVACGSGTLLVSAYLFKKELYSKFEHITAGELQKIHKTFVENHITGTDIMPFACHLAGINLSTQNVAVTTNEIRISCINSLDCSKDICQDNPTLIRATDSISTQFNKTHRPNKVLSDDFDNSNTKQDTPMPEQTNLDGFPIGHVDVIVMNPPFTDRNKMPKKYRESLFQHTELGDICGHEVNLWGYFLALADKLIKNDGRIGAIIPMNILRGYNTRVIRKYILENYHIEYIVKSTNDFSFSEDSDYKDIMLILQKRKAEKEDKTALVLVKCKFHDLHFTEIHTIRDRIKSQNIDEECKDEDIDIYWVSRDELLSNQNNLMPLLYAKSLDNKRLIDKFVQRVSQKSKNIAKIPEDKFKEGIKSPKNYKNHYYLTHNTEPNRVKRSFLSFVSENDKEVYATIKGVESTTIPIEKSALQRSLRTSTGLKTMDITEIHDYIIVKNYRSYGDFLAKAPLKNQVSAFSWDEARKFIQRADDTHIAVPNRIRLSSDNTYNLCLYSSDKFKPTNSFFSIDYNKEDSKIIALSMNSIFTICQFLQFVSSSFAKGKYYQTSVADWINMYQIDPSNITEKERKTLLTLFEKIGGSESLPLLQQLQSFHEDRLELDKTILKIMGLEPAYIEKTLPKIYEVVIDELINQTN